MSNYKKYLKGICVLILLGNIFWACSKDDALNPKVPQDTTNVTQPVPFDINKINDTYADVAPFSMYQKWGPYNVHDPSVLKDGEYFYSYSTDAGYGIDVRPGLQIRKSKDLINWEFVGWVFNGLPEKGEEFIKNGGGIPFNSLWAPYVLKVGGEYRLYYSLSSAKPRLSVIGLATSSSPVGPWTEKGLVVTSLADNSVQTNAIDPSVLIDQQGEHWMYYGSAWDGIYILKLNAATGLAASGGDKGKRIAQRGFSGDKINGNIEAPEIIYNQELNKYYLFISYDWLETKYNVRVGRADTPEGPFLDFNGVDLNVEEDHGPMIVAPYQFEGHGGWQGTAHCAVFEDNGQFYMAHQGRPGIDKYFMVMHVRKIYWTSDGWPVVSPERYAGVEQTPVSSEELLGEWEKITLEYNVVPGYAAEQVSPDFQTSVPLQLDAVGSIDGDAKSQWKYNAPILELSWSNGFTDKLIVERGRDWENKIESQILFTGLNNQGIAIWGKKKK